MFNLNRITMKNDKRQQNGCCDECEQMFEDNVQGLVDNVEGYTRKDHRDKSAEVHDAYSHEDSASSQERRDTETGSPRDDYRNANAGR